MQFRTMFTETAMTLGVSGNNRDNGDLMMLETTRAKAMASIEPSTRYTHDLNENEIIFKSMLKITEHKLQVNEASAQSHHVHHNDDHGPEHERAQVVLPPRNVVEEENRGASLLHVVNQSVYDSPLPLQPVDHVRAQAAHEERDEVGEQGQEPGRQVRVVLLRRERGYAAHYGMT